MLLVLAALVGVAPLILVGSVFSVAGVNAPGLPNVFEGTPTPTDPADLALPHPSWAAKSVPVVAQPASGQPAIATLDAGFPVSVTAHRRSGATLWSHIVWSGPTHATGGEGWVPDAALVGFGGQTRALGDLGALSPALPSALAPYTTRLGVALYFPESGQLYRTGADQPVALGDGLRPILLAALFARAEAPHAAALPLGAANAAALATRITAGDATSTTTAYTYVGDAAGISAYLSSVGITGIAPAAGDWLGAQATPNGLLQFYSALTTGQLLNAEDRAVVLAAAPASAGAGPTVPAGPANVLVIGATQTKGGWTMSACGSFAVGKGPRVVIAAVVRDQPTRDAAAHALALLTTRMTTLLSPS